MPLAGKNILSARKILTPPPTRLRPTVATLPNCSLLAIAYMGGESGGGKGGKSGGGW